MKKNKKIITTRKNWLSQKIPKFAGAALRLQGFVLLFSATPVFSDLVEKMGISSKIIDAFISGENQLDGGRERTYLLASTLLKENPWGLGVFWDRFYCEYHYPIYHYKA